MSLRTTVVFVSLLVLSAAPRMASAASIYADPATSTYGLGDTFISTIHIDNGNDCVNAVSVDITYSVGTLRAVDFSRGDSIFSLWVVEPRIDTAKGTITFAGGIPGGYCGRIAGDAALSNVLGSVVFTVIGTSSPTASIHIEPGSAVYINDGQGTKAPLTTRDAQIHILPKATLSENPWLAQVSSDDAPPQPFVVGVESTNGVFNGRYYAVFSTTDKESGMDHFEILEHGVWKHVTSPYVLENQSLLGVGDVEIRALDKAGNIRLGTYIASSTPQRQFSSGDIMQVFGVLLAIFALLFGVQLFRRHNNTPPGPQV